jgi:3-phosphoshikimate 1-carboxyvinyltransferase
MRTAPSVIGLPGCKSTTQRALLLAALAEGESRVLGASGCRDSAELLTALGTLGVESRWEGVPGADDALLLLHGAPPRALRAVGGEDVPVGEGASTLRFLMAVAAAGGALTRFRLAASLAARPHGELTSVLESLGASIRTDTDAAGAWLEVRGAGGFGARRVELPALRSSQTLSALWMAAGDAPITWSLAEPLAGSRGYLEMTGDMLRQARGARALIETHGGSVWEQAAGYGARARFRVMADPSAAVFFAVACILLRRSVRVARPWTARHADAALLRRLRGEDWLTWTPGEHGVELAPGPAVRRRELVVDLDGSPDCGPALAVLAACAPHGGRFTGLARLRMKESDRVAAMVRLAEACGATAEATDDALTIRPGGASARPGRPAAPRTRRVVTAGVHRTAMAAGVASLLHPGLGPDDPDCVEKSFPHFWEALECLRG